MERHTRINYPGGLRNFLFHRPNTGVQIVGRGDDAGAYGAFEDSQIAEGRYQQLAGVLHAVKVNRVPLCQRLPYSRTSTFEMRSRSAGCHYSAPSAPPAFSARFTMALLTSMEFT